MALVGTTASKVSYADLAQWPDDGRRYELYDGEVVVVPAPVPRHQRAVLRIARILDEYARDHRGEAFGAPLDIVVSRFDLVQPDVVYVGRERRSQIDLDRPLRFPPDLAVELLSPGTESIDRGRKMQLLARFGVPEYWLVDPYEHTVEVYRLTDGAYQLTQRAVEGDVVHSATLAGLEFPCAQIFADI